MIFSQKYAIKIEKRFNGEIFHSYKIGTYTEIQNIIQHFEQNIQEYLNEIKNRNKLDGLPKYLFKNVSYSMEESPNVNVIYEITYEHINKKKNLMWILHLGIVCFTISAILGFSIMLYFIRRDEEMLMIRETCFMYLKNGVPQSIEIDGTKYLTNEDGSIDDLDNVFMHEYHRDLINNQNCIKVNLE